VARMEGSRAILKGGDAVEADFVVQGVGVFARRSHSRRGAGLASGQGGRGERVPRDERAPVSSRGGGTSHGWPDPHTGQRIRVEHWWWSRQRQGQVAARNMLGRRERYEAVPFFWSQHYDVTVNYVGHAESCGCDGRGRKPRCPGGHRPLSARLVASWPWPRSAGIWKA
jgi:NADPH-dependent 2,4-dienoyl-CoA reductase/sulfur reductase-like enzyme